MSLTDQLQSAVSLASTIEQQLAAQTARDADLTLQVQTLTIENARLEALLTSTPTVPPVIEPPPPATLAWGFVANETDPVAALQTGITRMKSDGGAWLRLWHSHFDAFSSNTVSAINTAAAQGVNVLICLQPKDGQPATLGTPDIAGFVGKNHEALAKIHAVEVGNELNLSQYLPNDLGGVLTWQKPYVDRWLAPLRAALSPLNVRTLCTSITDTYHPDTYAQQYDLLKTAGAVEQSDGVAIHAYFVPQYLQQLSVVLARLKQTWNRPIYVTECNVQTRGLTHAQWPNQFAPYMKVLREANVAMIAFYRGFPKATGTWTWPTLFDANGNVTDAYGTLLKTVR